MIIKFIRMWFFYFERVKSNVELLLFSSFLCYYNGNIENYKKILVHILIY